MSFRDSLALVLRHEGGYVNNAHDKGGETNFGISKRAYPRENIKGMTIERATEIYERDFWRAAHCDEFPAGLAMCVFDFAVTSGVGTAVRTLQRALRLVPDGVVGPNTLAQARFVPERTALQFTALRCLFYASLPTADVFGLGWTSRAISTLLESKRYTP